MSTTMTAPTLRMSDAINPIDREELRAKVRAGKHFPFFQVDNFLKEGFANRVLEAFPSYEQAKKIGRQFAAVNEKGKVQGTDPRQFSEPVRQLNEVLAAQEFLDLLSYAMDIPK